MKEGKTGIDTMPVLVLILFLKIVLPLIYRIITKTGFSPLDMVLKFRE